MHLPIKNNKKKDKIIGSLCDSFLPFFILFDFFFSDTIVAGNVYQRISKKEAAGKRSCCANRPCTIHQPVTLYTRPSLSLRVLLSAPVFPSAHQTGGETTTKKDGRKLSIRINRNTTPDPSNNLKRHPAASRTVAAGLPTYRRKNKQRTSITTRRRRNKKEKNTQPSSIAENL
jgi:hypothetical protein